MNFKRVLNKYLRGIGYEMSKYPGKDLQRRATIIKNLDIDAIIDVGANSGQYAQLMRELGYAEKIISFEPVKGVFNELSIKAKKDAKWDVYNYALGDKNETASINISQNTYSSSILSMEERHVVAAPESIVVQTEIIEIKTLDDIYEELFKLYTSPFLKLDVQGYEKNVLEGAKKTLKKIKGIQVELSLLPLYKMESLFDEMINYLKAIGFELVSLENGLTDPETSFLLQVDGIFIKRDKD